MQWYRLTSGPVWKIVNIWPKNIYVVPFQKLVFLISLYPEFLEKNQRNKKKVDFWSIRAVFVSPSMLI